MPRYTVESEKNPGLSRVIASANTTATTAITARPIASPSDRRCVCGSMAAGAVLCDGRTVDQDFAPPQDAAIESDLKNRGRGGT